MSGEIDAIGRYIATELLVSMPGPGRDDSLIGSGLLDSLALLRVIAFIQEEFGIDVEDGEVTPENFETLARIAGYIEQKRRLAGA